MMIVGYCGLVCYSKAMLSYKLKLTTAAVVSYLLYLEHDFMAGWYCDSILAIVNLHQSDITSLSSSDG